MLQPWSRSSGSQTSACFPNAMMASRTLRLFRRPSSTRKARRGVGAQPCSAKCFPNKAGMTGCTSSSNSHSRTSANPVRVGAVNRNASHVVGGVPEPLEIRLGLTIPLKACWVTGLHVEAHDAPRIVVHRVPEPAMTMLDTGLLDVVEEAGRGRLPAVVFFGFDAGCMVHHEGPVSEGLIA